MEKDILKKFHVELLKTLQIFYTAPAARIVFNKLLDFLENPDNTKELQ